MTELGRVKRAFIIWEQIAGCLATATRIIPIDHRHKGTPLFHSNRFSMTAPLITSQQCKKGKQLSEKAHADAQSESF